MDTKLDINKIVEQGEHAYNFRHRSPIRAPGIVIGAAMVELAMKNLGDVKKLGAVAEAKACLSDSVQALTGCTVGNKYLKIYEKIGRYALTLYDRTNGNGIRVHIDLKKLDSVKTPELYKFFHRKRAPEVRYDMEARALSAKKVVEEFVTINHDILDLEKDEMLSAKICPDCGESFTFADENQTLCLVCSKKQDYYTKR